MDTSAIEALSTKLIHIIKTRDPDKVRFWADQLDRQKNQFLVAQICTVPTTPPNSKSYGSILSIFVA
jgi:hypothetical protein